MPASQPSPLIAARRVTQLAVSSRALRNRASPMPLLAVRCLQKTNASGSMRKCQLYEASQTFRQRINPVLHDLSEREGEKSQIFLLPFRSNHVKRDLSFTP